MIIEMEKIAPIFPFRERIVKSSSNAVITTLTSCVPDNFLQP